jgi:hypothetical protein
MTEVQVDMAMQPMMAMANDNKTATNAAPMVCFTGIWVGCVRSSIRIPDKFSMYLPMLLAIFSAC